MKTKTFYIILISVLLIGVGTTVCLLAYGINLWKTISIVELIANWT